MGLESDVWIWTPVVQESTLKILSIFANLGLTSI